LATAPCTARGHRPPDLSRMKGTLCQLSYRGAVLTPGVEPDPTAYQTVMQTAYTRSGRKVEVPTPRGLSRARAFKARCRAGDAPSMAETGGLDPQWLITTHPVSNRSRPGPVQLPYAEDGGPDPRRSPASPALQAGPARAGSSSMSGRRADRTRVGRQPQPRFSKPVPLPLGQPSIVR
jgi:hypothetical protein